MNITRINRDEAVLVLVDFQERLMPAMRKCDKVIGKAAMLAKGCKEFDIPMLVTQQYTKGMGDTVPEMKEALGEFEHIEKKEFSCMMNQEFKAALAGTGRKTAIVTGCETHVCVLQTVLDLLAEDYNVYIVTDCVSSRKRNTRDTAIERMIGAGAIPTTAEAVLFELLRSADDPAFKAISKLVK